MTSPCDFSLFVTLLCCLGQLSYLLVKEVFFFLQMRLERELGMSTLDEAKSWIEFLLPECISVFTLDLVSNSSFRLPSSLLRAEITCLRSIVLLDSSDSTSLALPYNSFFSCSITFFCSLLQFSIRSKDRLSPSTSSYLVDLDCVSVIEVRLSLLISFSSPCFSLYNLLIVSLSAFSLVKYSSLAIFSF